MARSKLFRFTFALSLLNLIFVTLVILRMPENVPVQVNTAGEISSMGSRWVYLILGAIAPLNCLTALILPKADPNRESYQQHARPFRINKTAFSLLFIILSWIALPIAFMQRDGFSYPFVRVIQGVIALLLMVAGNYLPKAQPNYTWGIKTPWALADARVWQRTHRLGGWLFFGVGAGLLVMTLLPLHLWIRTALFPLAIVILFFIPRIYAWYIGSMIAKGK